MAWSHEGGGHCAVHMAVDLPCMDAALWPVCTVVWAWVIHICVKRVDQAPYTNTLRDRGRVLSLRLCCTTNGVRARLALNVALSMMIS